MQPRRQASGGAALAVLWAVLGAAAATRRAGHEQLQQPPPAVGSAPSPWPAAPGLGPLPQAVQQLDPLLGPLPSQPLPFQGPPSDMQGQPPPQLKSQGMLTMRSLRIASNAEEGSKMYLGPQGEFSIGTDASSGFTVRQASQSAPLLALDAQNTLHLGAQRVEALSVDATGGLSLRGVRQWQLVRAEDFSTSAEGWSRGQAASSLQRFYHISKKQLFRGSVAAPSAATGCFVRVVLPHPSAAELRAQSAATDRCEVSQCAGVFMLGGYCRLSRGEVNKTYAGLPPHKQIRIVANFHFIDRWIGEAGYMKLDIGPGGHPVVVWSEQHSEQMSRNGISLCGRSYTPEGKFAAPIDVTVPHQMDSVQLSFGSTMEDCDPCDESWGVSGVEIYTRV